MRFFSELLGYAMASAVALVIDAGLLYYLVKYCQFGVVLAASLSFCAGAVVAYVLAVRLAFSAHRLASRRAEFLIFFVLGLVGLAVNAGIMAVGTRLGFDLTITKLVAAGATFLCNFLLRRCVLFVAPKRADDIGYVLAE